MTNQTRIAVVGCGGISRAHATGIKQHPKELNIVACADIDGERAAAWAEKWQVPQHFTDWQAMVSEVKPDLLIFATWPIQHLEQVSTAAKMGVPAILSEKSLGMSAEECRAMHAACSESGTLLMEAFMFRHTPRCKEFLKKVHEGFIGDLRYAHAAFSAPGFDPNDNNNNWRNRPETGGGVVYDFTCYPINILGGLFQRKPQRAIAAAEICQKTKLVVSMHGMLDYGDGVVGHIESSRSSATRMDATAVGSESRLTLPSFLLTQNRLGVPPIIHTTGSHFGAVGTQTIPAAWENPYGLESLNMARALRGEEELVLSVEETTDNLAVIDALVKSLESNTWEEVI